LPCNLVSFLNQWSGIDFFACNDAKAISKEQVASDYTLGVVARFGKGCFTLNADYKCLFKDPLGVSRSAQLIVKP
jgi:hypothetical protein